MIINSRKRSIINLLINNPKTLEQISKEIEVSTRTIRRDFISINQVLEKYSYEINKVNKAYVIIDKNKNLNKILDKNNQLDFNLKEKALIYLTSITGDKKDIIVNNMAEELYISSEKVKEEINKILLENNIEFIYQKGKFTIDIVPLEKINKFFEIVKEYFSSYEIEDIILEGNINNIGITKIKKYLKYYFQINRFSEVLTTIQEVFNENNNYINDQEVFDLTLKILIYLQQGNDAVVTNSINSLLPNKMAEQINKKLKITNKNTESYIISEINNLITEFEIEKIEYRRIEKIQKFTKSFLEKLNIHNVNTQNLEYKILLHDKRSKHTKGKIENEKSLKALEDLIQNSPKVYEVLKEVNYKYKIYTLEELKYIFIYCIIEIDQYIVNNSYNIVFVTSQNTGSSLMIQNQLKGYLPNSKIKVASLRQLTNIDKESTDLIISSNALPNNTEDLKVGYTISNDDFINIRNKLLNINIKRRNKFPNSNILIRKSTKVKASKYESLQRILSKLEKENIVNDGSYLLEKLKKREKAGIAIPNSKVAFYHTRSSSVNAGIIYVIKTDNFHTLSLNMKKQMCNTILLLLIPNTLEQSLTEKINLLSYKLITDKELIKKIQNQEIKKLKQMIIE